MEKSIAAATLASRPWYRLHLSTWLVLPLGLAVAVLVVVPGGAGSDPAQAPWDYPTFNELVIVHGWPFPFLWRDFDESSGRVPRAAPLLAWNFADSVRGFRLLPLVVDSIVALTAVALFAAAVEWRRRRRSRAVQFTLRELLAFAMAAAICCGWWSHRRAVDGETAARLSKVDRAYGWALVPHVPLWLRGCVGDKALAWLGIDEPTGVIVLQWDRSQQRDIEYIVGQHPQGTVVVVDGAISDGDAAAVAGIERLERLSCNWPTTAMGLARLVARLQHHPGLREVELYAGGGSAFDDAELAQLATIPRLRSLSILDDCSRVTERGIAALRNCGNLEVLELDNLRLTTDVVKSLGEIRQLRALNLTRGQFINADISPLRRLDTLEELALWGTNLDDSDARRLRDFPALRRLDIACTQMTQAGVKELLDPSAESSARRLEQICVDADSIDDDLIAAFQKLPRLHLIRAAWPDAGTAAHRDRDRYYYDQLINRLQQALPDREIDDGGPVVVS